MDDLEHTCWLCGRALGRKVEWHHPVPKSRGGRATEPVHPICHRTLHASFTNVQLAQFGGDAALLRARPELARFLTWIAGKPPDFHAPTHRKR
ncbi:HNH endonuclease [Novosphingobium profundi]|uniref:HNH endonuclease n=1 Tax=Novosphingobium profundi TaxID=1774954 RepID=UPI001BDA09E3|nr:HNH endonuclease [Novosphingobium profundi]MBT0669672.1 HNH endonuclease [Novosphingobium profundi]